MVQIVEQTYKEKIAMYMKLTKKKLAEMLIECNRILEAQLQAKNIAIENCTLKHSKTMKDTAMKELRDKLLTVVKDLDKSPTTEYYRGYCDALKNVALDIDVQMMRIERQNIVDAYDANLYGGLSGDRKFTDGDYYYNSTFGELHERIHH